MEMKTVVDVVQHIVYCRYEEKLQEQQGQLEKDDLSDMVAEHAARQKVTIHSSIQSFC